MKKYVLAFIIAAITSLCVSAEGEMKRYEVNVNDFSELKVLEGLNVDYKCSEDSNGYVVFNAAPHASSIKWKMTATHSSECSLWLPRQVSAPLL